MAKYVIGVDVALRLASDGTVPGGDHKLLAPTLLRSQVLAQLYQAVGRGELTKQDASRRLDHVRALHIRLLGDRVLQNTAWKVAERLGWPDTYDAEYVALTQLQGDALVTLDHRLAGAARELVKVVSPNALG